MMKTPRPTRRAAPSEIEGAALQAGPADQTSHARPRWRTAARALVRKLAGATSLALLCTSLIARQALAGEETAVGTVEVVNGTGALTVNEDLQTTLTSEGTVTYGWSGIDQPADHTLEFDQSGSDATAINLGKGQNPFEFFGTVKSNGRVIFANEAGVHFRDGSSVLVAELIAAAVDSTRSNFDTMLLQGAGGAVINEGTIIASSVTLFGERVANHGNIYVPDGKLLMLAGDTVWIREHGSPIVVKVPFDGHSYGHSPETTSVENTGLIDAGEHGTVRLAAADGLAYAIRNHVVERYAQSAGGDPPESGVIRAGTIEIEAGEGGAVEIGGTLDATREGKRAVGGDISVFGERILVDDDARIDATGSEGGGRIRIGGDRHGTGDMQKAALVFVSDSAEIRADAEYAGDGGEVIIWSDGHAYVHGEVSARGGEHGGDGGFVETSGRAFLDVSRAANVAARAGRAPDTGGEWLIDPYDIRIVDFVATPEDCEVDPRCLDNGIDLDDLFFVNNPILFPGAESSELSAGVIEEALTSGSSLTITTATGTEELGAQLGNITVDADILPGDGADENTAVVLALRAANNVIVNADIGGAAGDDRYENLNLGVQLIANDNASQAEAPVDDGQVPNEFIGNVEVNGNINSNRSDVIMQGVDIVLAEGTEINTDGGSVLIAAIGSIDPNTGSLSGGGSAYIEGDIDTSNSRTDERGEQLDGGTVTIQARYGLVGQQGGGPESATLQGGKVRVLGDIELGQHDRGVTALDIEGLGGDVEIEGAITSGGGTVELLSVRVAEGPDATDQEQGGHVYLRPDGSITTEGGDVEIEATGSFSEQALSRDFRTEVHINGRIDTSPAEGEDDLDRDGRIDTVGGNVLIRAEGFDDSNPSGLVSIIDQRSWTPPVEADTREELAELAETYMIYTAGGDVEVNFDVDTSGDGVPDGSSYARLELGASIHAGLAKDAELDVALEDAVFGRVFLDSASSLVFENRSDTLLPDLVRGEQVGMRSANRGVVRGDLEFVSKAGVGPEIWADDIELRAGSDSLLGFFETQSRISANDLVLYDAGGGSDINSLTYAQNAAIVDSLLPGESDVLDPATHFGGGAVTLDGLVYVIQSMTGSITLVDPSKLAGTPNPGQDPELGALLELMAEDDLELIGLPSEWDTADLQALDLTINLGFTVDTDLAANASAATDDMIITTGRRTPLGGRADLRVEDGVTLEASESLLLHAASGGTAGDVVFGTESGGSGDTIELRSSDLQLWAGSGVGARVGLSVDNRVHAAADSPTPVEFFLGDDADLGDDDFRSFSLRQEAAITDDDLPDVDQFDVGGSLVPEEIGLIDYELRSDSADITLGFEGGQKLQRTNLRLLARDGVNVDMGVDEDEEPRILEVRTLDVGGTVDFEVTQQLIDQFDFAGPGEVGGASPSAVTFRAGVDEPGTLSFEVRNADVDPEEAPTRGELTIISADEIRLVASDGTGGNGSSAGSAGSRIAIHDGVRFWGVQTGEVDGEPVYAPVSRFVFRQDQSLQVIIDQDGTASPLPDIDVNFDLDVDVAPGQDREGEAPGVYVLQSDDGAMQLSLDLLDSAGNDFDFARLLPLATERVILAAAGLEPIEGELEPGVILARIDGRDLDLETIFSADGATATLLEIRADTIELAAADSDLAVVDEITGEARPVPDDPARVLVGDTDDLGLYVYGFGGEELDDRTGAPVPEALDLEAQLSKNGSIPEIFSIEQDATIESDALLDLARSGSGHGLGRGPCPTADPDCGDDRRRTGYLLSSLHGDIAITPEKTFGGRIVLELPLALQDDPRKSSRQISFEGGPDPVFFTESFEAVSAFEWQVGRATDSLTIQAADFISLRSGTSGRGDLGFLPDVTLQAEEIRLGAFGGAGHDSSNINLPIVDAYTNDPTFDFFQPDDLPDSFRQDSNDDRFTIVQDGWVNDTWHDRPATGTRRTLPVPSQFVNAGLIPEDDGSGSIVPPLELFAYSIQSNRRGITIRDLDNVRASRLLLLANSDRVYDDDPDTDDRSGVIEINHTIDPGDGYTATPVPSISFEDAGISRAALIGDEIRLVAGAGGAVDASHDVFFSANGGENAPDLAFLISQDQSFIDDNSAGDNSDDLPDFFQFASGLNGVEYTLQLREGAGAPGEIQIGSNTARKVRGTRLVLEALDSVKIDVPEVLLEGLVLTSLDVGRTEGYTGSLTIEIGNVFDPGTIDTESDVVATLIETGQHQRYDGLVEIKGLVEMRGGDIEFTGDVRTHSGATDPTAFSGLDFLTRGTVSFAGNVGCHDVDPDLCTIEGEQWGGPPTNSADDWLDLIRVRFDADDESRDALAFVGDGAQSVFARDVEIFAVSPTEDFENLDSEVVRVPDVASIYKLDGDYDPETDAGSTTGDALTFYTEDRFRVGTGQKISSQGGFAVHSRDLIQVGDVAALGIALEVDPDDGAIEILRRPAGTYIEPDGTVLKDAGVSFVTNSMTPNVAPTVVGEGRSPSLAIEDPRDESIDDTLAAFTLTAIDVDGRALTKGDFAWQFENAPAALPALHAFGPPRNDISQAFVGEEITPPPLPWMPSEWRVADARRLRELAVRPRDRTVAEWHRYLDGAGIIDDIGSGTARRDGLAAVAQPRLLAQDAQRSIELYEQVFGEDGVHSPRVRAILADALEQYQRSSGTRRVVGFEFRRYVKNRPSSLFDAYQVFEDLDALFDHHRALGLTPGEYRPIQAAWLEQIRPEGITIDELAEAVHPSRYVRGTDILEIFGD